MLVKISYDTGEYNHIYEAANDIEWGRNFIRLAMRVVYVLDKR